MQLWSEAFCFASSIPHPKDRDVQAWKEPRLAQPCRGLEHDIRDYRKRDAQRVQDMKKKKKIDPRAQGDISIDAVPTSHPRHLPKTPHATPIISTSPQPSEPDPIDPHTHHATAVLIPLKPPTPHNEHITQSAPGFQPTWDTFRSPEPSHAGSGKTPTAPPQPCSGSPTPPPQQEERAAVGQAAVSRRKLAAVRRWGRWRDQRYNAGRHMAVWRVSESARIFFFPSIPQASQPASQSRLHEHRRKDDDPADDSLLRMSTATLNSYTTAVKRRWCKSTASVDRAAATRNSQEQMELREEDLRRLNLEVKEDQPDNESRNTRPPQWLKRERAVSE
ncbi:MAG: hypothetical protein Q9161_004472 [Pseudevernia consocians]